MDLTEAKHPAQNRHFWELSRADSVIREARNLNGMRCLDFGAGDLYFARHLQEKTGTKVVAYDPLASYSINSPQLLATNSLELVKENGPYDRIFLLDVLEHIENEAEALALLATLLSPAGELIITVPAYQFLFSDHDTFLKHYRRYNQNELHRVLQTNKFNVQKGWYFYHSLFLIRLLQKAVDQLRGPRKAQEGVGGWQFTEKHPITQMFRLILNVDFWLSKTVSKLGLRLPGLSLFAVCKKTSA